MIYLKQLIERRKKMDFEKTVEKWLNHPNLRADLKKELEQMSTENQQAAFFKMLEFGTAGMRGIMGPGTNRMNIYLIRQVTEALAKKLLKEHTADDGVVIAYDSRHHSKDFAKEAAATLATHGVKVYLFTECCPTPELSFAIRYLKAAAGIMITASHNPREYNGYKIYNHLGGQLLPEKVKDLLAFVDKNKDPLEIAVEAFEKMKATGRIHELAEKMDAAYLKALEQVNLNQPLTQEHGADLKIIFTPLHGTGQRIGPRALQQAGFSDVRLVESQAVPDPNFPTVQSPNPESLEAFTLGIEQATVEKADVVIATDPDADRIGVAVTADYKEYKILTGNQLAALLVNYILTTKKATESLTGNELLITSRVSSTLPEAIAKSFGVATKYVLTGFKYIADLIEQEEANFLFGFEESMGYLFLPFVRDKDAMQALLLVSELLLSLKENQSNALEQLEKNYQKYGYYAEKTLDFTFNGQEKMNQLLTELRENLPQKLAGLEVCSVEDYLKGQITKEGKIRSFKEFPQTNMLRFELESGSWVAIRPSGTEPKLKIYIGSHAKTSQQAEKIIEELTGMFAGQVKSMS